jgi:hypothetical protein
MVKIAMIPLDSVRKLHRSVIAIERRMSGSGGDDYLCGHCGSLILEDFDPAAVHGSPVYQCGFCENMNDIPRV